MKKCMKVTKMAKMTTAMVKEFFKENWKMSDKILVVANGILVGILLGALWSPKRKKNTVLASYNNENGCGNSPSEEQEEA